MNMAQPCIIFAVLLFVPYGEVLNCARSECFTHFQVAGIFSPFNCIIIIHNWVCESPHSLGVCADNLRFTLEIWCVCVMCEQNAFQILNKVIPNKVDAFFFLISVLFWRSPMNVYGISNLNINAVSGLSSVFFSSFFRLFISFMETNQLDQPNKISNYFECGIESNSLLIFADKSIWH